VQHLANLNISDIWDDFNIEQKEAFDLQIWNVLLNFYFPKIDWRVLLLIKVNAKRVECHT
jgi:hypothetical protein